MKNDSVLLHAPGESGIQGTLKNSKVAGASIHSKVLANINGPNEMNEQMTNQI